MIAREKFLPNFSFFLSICPLFSSFNSIFSAHNIPLNFCFSSYHSPCITLYTAIQFITVTYMRRCSLIPGPSMPAQEAGFVLEYICSGLSDLEEIYEYFNHAHIHSYCSDYRHSRGRCTCPVEALSIRLSCESITGMLKRSYSHGRHFMDHSLHVVSLCSGINPWATSHGHHVPLAYFKIERSSLYQDDWRFHLSGATILIQS